MWKRSTKDDLNAWAQAKTTDKARPFDPAKVRVMMERSLSETGASSFPEIAANAALVLIGVACALRDRQILSQAEAFVEEGGFTERLYRVRTARRRHAPR